MPTEELPGDPVRRKTILRSLWKSSFTGEPIGSPLRPLPRPWPPREPLGTERGPARSAALQVCVRDNAFGVERRRCAACLVCMHRPTEGMQPPHHQQLPESELVPARASRSVQQANQPPTASPRAAAGRAMRHKPRGRAKILKWAAFLGPKRGLGQSSRGTGAFWGRNFSARPLAVGRKSAQTIPEFH